jgi:hypothetical protein
MPRNATGNPASSAYLLWFTASQLKTSFTEQIEAPAAATWWLPR